jgi:hypothetical protein
MGGFYGVDTPTEFTDCDNVIKTNCNF